MKFYYYCPSIIFFMVMFTSCEKQGRDYKLERNDFLYPLAGIIEYQQVLDTEISKIQDQPAFASFLAQRREDMASYITEIESICSLPKAGLTAEAQTKLSNLQNSQGAGFNKLLLRLVMEADEDLIGLHVKASGSAGLKDTELRQWTAEKIPMLTKRLDASQTLWHIK